MTFVALVIFAYLLGAVPFGLLVGRLFADIDVRSYGSGNIGATNVNRVLGRKLGAATLICDVLKGVFVVLLSKFLLPGDLFAHGVVGFSAFIGHCFPIYLKFKGGKGVATMFGVLAVLSFLSALVTFAVWFLVARITRISSLGAISSSLIAPVSIYIIEKDFSLALLFVLFTSVLIFRHRDNISRLRSGTES